MLRNATVRELLLGTAFCQFCHFLIYNSVRFIYIPVTFSFALFILPPIAENRHRHFRLAILATFGKPLFLNGFFLPKRLPKLATSATKIISH